MNLSLFWDSFRQFAVGLTLVTVAGTAISQPNQFEYYSLDDGLSERLVTNILLSREGFAWIGTENGLNKFDGYEFSVFNNYSNKSRGNISGSNILQLAEDCDGNLIIRYENNPILFDIFNPGSYENERVNLLPETGIKGIVRGFHVDNNGEIYIATVSNSRGLNIYHYTGAGQFEQVFSIYSPYINPSINIQFLHTRDGKFFINDSERGLRLYGKEGTLIKSFDQGSFECLDIQEAQSGNFNFIKEDRRGNVWLSQVGTKGLFLFLPDKQFFVRPDYVDQTLHYKYWWQDQSGNILLGNSQRSGSYSPLQGLYCITAGFEWKDFSKVVDLNKDITITCIAGNDFFKQLFLGMDTGFKIISNAQAPVKTYLAANLPIDQRGAVIRGITGDDKKIYFAREVDSWYSIDRATGLLDTLPLMDEQTGEKIEFTCGLGLYLAPDGYLWGTTCYKSSLGQLHKMDLQTHTVKTYRFDYVFNAFTVDKNGIFWLGCTMPDQKGLLVSFNPVTEKFTTFKNNQDEQILQGAVPKYMTTTKEGLLWIGTENGLFKVDTEQKTSHQYKMDRESPNSLNNNSIYVIYEDKNGQLYLGTKNGLNIFDPQNENVTVYTKDDGLAGNTVYGIVSDESENFWISTFNGLSYFNHKDKAFRNFYQSDGFSHNEFNRLSFYRDDNGFCYFGSVNGLNVFNPKDLLVNRQVPPPVLTKITRFNTKQDNIVTQVANLSGLKELRISPYDSYFTLHFALPVYGSSRKNQFMVRLEGLEKDWSYWGNTPYVRYNQLPPGTYTFRVRGADANGNWSQESLEIQLCVEQVFYRTWWFLTISFLFTALIVRWIFRQQLEQRLNVERLRMKLSSDLHDELSGLLSGIALQTDMLQMQVANEDIAHRLQAIGEVSRSAMSKMSDVIWSIDSRKDKVGDLVNRMKEHAAEILSPLDISFDFQILKLDEEQKMPANIRQDLYFIFKEAVNNVAKHANATKVGIQLSNLGPHFEMSIRDNGKGVPVPATANEEISSKSNKKTGQGMTNLQMRAQRLNAELEIKRENGFVVVLKMKRFI